MSQLVDQSPRNGVFIGDLKYGRKNGSNTSKHGDFSGKDNEPVMPLILVTGRTPELWSKDPQVKRAKRNIDNSQHGINYMIKAYQENINHMRGNIHVTVGRQRL